MIKLGDYTGILASIFCLLHCLLTPLALLLPFLVQIPVNEDFHYWMMVVVVVPVMLSLIPGFIMHKKIIVLFLGLIGIICFVFSILVVEPLYGELAEVVVTSIGSVNFIIAHIKNRGYCKKCEREEGCLIELNPEHQKSLFYKS